jgi:cytochrome c oxidase subunit 2
VNRKIILILAVWMLGLISACDSTVVSPEAGQNLAVIKGCAACHAADDTPDKLGPTWEGLYGSKVELSDGRSVTADDDYLIEAIEEPNAKIVEGYSKGSMPAISLTDDELNALLAYIKSLE